MQCSGSAGGALHHQRRQSVVEAYYKRARSIDRTDFRGLPRLSLDIPGLTLRRDYQSPVKRVGCDVMLVGFGAPFPIHADP